jgi:molecular chaperone GrpE (heat shock protein)
MRVFNLAEELEKERKKVKELKADLKEANESITWWTNRFNAVERDNREIQNRIDKAVEIIKKYGYEKQMEEDYLMNRVNLANYNCLLLDILEGNNNE